MNVRRSLHELARARADTEGQLNSPMAAGNLAYAGTLATDAFFAHEVPRQGSSSRVSRATLHVAAMLAMRHLE